MVGEIVNVPSELDTEETPVTRQVPDLAKQPSVILKPLFNVEVAPLVRVIFPPVTNSPP